MAPKKDMKLHAKSATATSAKFDATNSDAMPVMMTGSQTIEEQMSSLQQVVAELTLALEDRDKSITLLMDKVQQLENRSSSTPTTDMVVDRTNVDQGKHPQGDVAEASNATYIPKASTIQTMTENSISVMQIKEMIKEAIKEQTPSTMQSSYTYSKPYTRRIDLMHLPENYQPPKFQQFDGKGNPRQHIAHFVETCNNAGTYGDLMVKQFVRSLKDNAFDWYIDLMPGSIDSWEQLEQEFLNRFYSTRRIVSMMELTNTHQWKDEAVIDYINRWRNLNLNCRDQLSESSAIEMCIQGMHWGLSYILQGNKPRSFEELATRAHDMELSIAAAGNQTLPIRDPKKSKEKSNAHDGGNTSMAISTTSFKILSKLKASKDAKPMPSQEKGKKSVSLKERQEKTYPFSDLDLVTMLEDLLKAKLIVLPDMKRPDEANQVANPNYCKYHRLIGHPIEKCFVLKDKIMDLYKKGLIEFDEEVASSNMVEINKAPATSKFGSLGPIETPYSLQPTNSKEAINFAGGIKLQGLQEKHIDRDEGYTLITCRRGRKKSLPMPKQTLQRTKLVKVTRKKVDMEHYKKPFTSLSQPKVSKPLLKGLTRSSQGSFMEHDNLPVKHINGFDPNAYKLFGKAGCDEEKMQELIGDESKVTKHDKQTPVKTKRVWRKKNLTNEVTKAGLGHKANLPLRWKAHKMTSQHITMEECDDGETHQEKLARTSVFDRLGRSSSRGSVFYRIGLRQEEGVSSSLVSVREKLGISNVSMKKPSPKPNHEVTIDHKEFHSKVPTHMKRKVSLNITNDGMMKGKSHTVVLTKGEVLMREKDAEAFPVYHVAITNDEAMDKQNTKDVPPTFEEGVKFLKQHNE